MEKKIITLMYDRNRISKLIKPEFDLNNMYFYISKILFTTKNVYLNTK